MRVKRGILARLVEYLHGLGELPFLEELDHQPHRYAAVIPAAPGEWRHTRHVCIRTQQVS